MRRRIKAAPKAKSNKVANKSDSGTEGGLWTVLLIVQIFYHVPNQCIFINLFNKFYKSAKCEENKVEDYQMVSGKQFIFI